MSSGFGSGPYGIDVPLVNPYSRPVSIADRPLRADARRNREQILKAAKAVIAKCGPEAQMDDIARRAKVGVGTLYRHFPTKEALIRALMADRVATIAGYVHDALEEPDSFEGLCRSMWRGAELGVRDRGMSMIFSPQQFKEAHAAFEELNRAAGELVRRAQEQGRLRPDFRRGDIGILMCGVMNAIDQMGHDPDAWQRHLRLVFDGMRARPDLEPLPSG